MTRQELVEKMARYEFDTHCVDCAWEDLKEADRYGWLFSAQGQLQVVLDAIEAGEVVDGWETPSGKVILKPDFRAGRG